MTRIELSEKFKSQLKKLKDEKLRDSIEKMLKDLLEDPNIGKPLRYSFKKRFINKDKERGGYI